jgi:hypothetical protein
MKIKILGFITVALFSVFVFAQSADVVPAPSLVAVSHAVDKIPAALPAWVLAVLAFLTEVGLRFYPTVQPKSLLIYAASLIGLLGAGFVKISNLLDQVIQNIKDPAPKA